MQIMFILHKAIVGSIPLIYATYLCGWTLQHNVMDCALMILIGSVVSTTASFLIDATVRALGIPKYTNYRTYIRASAMDPKIDRLNCERILYRDLVAMFFITTIFAACLMHFCAMILLGILSLVRMIQFHKRISERIDMLNILDW